MTHNYVFCFSKVNMEKGVQVFIGAVLNKLTQASPFGSITPMGRVRFIVSVFFFIVFTYQCGMDNYSRLDFICSHEISDYHRQLTFSYYSSEMFPLMSPYQFLLLTACVQVVLWTAMIQYGSMYLQKITTKRITSLKLSRKEKNLWHKLWKWGRCHVCCEAIVVSFMMGLVIYTQDFNVPETYRCTFISAEVTPCIDECHRKKLFQKWLLIIVMAIMLGLCIWTFQQMWNEQNFIKDLLVLNTPASNGGKGMMEMLFLYH